MWCLVDAPERPALFIEEAKRVGERREGRKRGGEKGYHSHDMIYKRRKNDFLK